MGLKLGEAMIRDGLITRDQLRVALERQVVFGGRIGTNIVELGILAEKDLSAFLSRFFKMPAVDPAQLTSVDPQVIACLSRELAEKYKVVPFKKERNRLHVAVSDPLSMSNADALRFITGYDFIFYVLSELRLLFALEKYYGIERNLRYISVFGKGKTQEPTREDVKKELNKVKEQFAQVQKREETIGILLYESSRVASRTAVFVPKGDRIMGWRSRGMTVDHFNVPAAADSVFSEVIGKKTCYRGPLAETPGNEALISVLSGVPRDCIVISIHIRGNIIALMYADNGNSSELSASLTYFDTLATMASLSFEIIMLRQKLLDLLVPNV